MADHWTSSSPTIRRSSESRKEAVRCLRCWGLFYRVPGSADTCPEEGCEDAECSTNVFSARRRPA